MRVIHDNNVKNIQKILLKIYSSKNCVANSKNIASKANEMKPGFIVLIVAGVLILLLILTFIILYLKKQKQNEKDGKSNQEISIFHILASIFKPSDDKIKDIASKQFAEMYSSQKQFEKERLTFKEQIAKLKAKIHNRNLSNDSEEIEINV